MDNHIIIMLLGLPLFTLNIDLDLFNPEFNDSYDLFFVSNRIEAHHLAFSGFFANNLSYRTKLTYSINHGSYSGANKGRNNWGSRRILNTTIIITLKMEENRCIPSLK